MWDFLSSRADQIAFSAWQHLSLVVQCLVLGTVIAVGIAALVYRSRPLSSLANSVSAIGLTLPAFALVGLLIAPLGFGVAPAVAVVTFFAVLPILRNAVVGLTGIDPAIVESARGIGMGRVRTLLRVELPLAWPVILGGIRLSVVISLATATIGSTVAAKTLGEVIIAGLLSNNLAFILQGGVIVAVLAVLIYDALSALERMAARRTGTAV